MKRFVAITLTLLLFSAAFAVGAGEGEQPRWADSLRSLHCYTEGLKARAIHGDTVRAYALFREALAADSLYAPAAYELANGRHFTSVEEGVTLARRAYESDTLNKWYHRLYGQMLLVANRYEEALPLFRALTERDPEPENYRILAALYEQLDRPFSALSTLDSAEVRFGRIPQLSRMKRQLLTHTRQYDKALGEAEALIEAAPYEAENHVELAELYAMQGKDSLARASYNRALAIDSMNLMTLMSLSDFFNAKRDYRSMLWATSRMFQNELMPLEVKLKRFDIFTSDIDFYRSNYFQIHELAGILAQHYPRDSRVVKLYADHLIASGELDEALEHYKIHLTDEPPQTAYYEAIIDIESYKQRPDSAMYYIDRALEVFPEQISFRIDRGNVLYYQKRFNRAVKAYRAALKYADTDSLRSTIWGQIGDVRQAQGEQAFNGWAFRRAARRACYKAYEKALAYDPDNILVLNNYAYHLAVEGRSLERALKMAERVIELTDKNPTYMDTYAWVLFRLGRLTEARTVQRQAVAFDGQRSMELLVHYGDILHALGEQYMAETYWKKALEKGYDKATIDARLAQPAVKKEQ